MTKKPTKAQLRLQDGLDRKARGILQGLRIKYGKSLPGIDKDVIWQLLFNAIGQPCPYCRRTLSLANLQLDHQIPIGRGGKNEVVNYQIICKTCNRRKDVMTWGEYQSLLDWLDVRPVEVKTYVLSKLSQKPMFAGKQRARA